MVAQLQKNNSLDAGIPLEGQDEFINNPDKILLLERLEFIADYKRFLEEAKGNEEEEDCVLEKDIKKIITRSRK